MIAVPLARAFGRSRRLLAFSHFCRRYADQVGLTIKARRFSNRLQLIMAVFPMLIFMILYLGVVHLDPNRLSTGNFLAQAADGMRFIGVELDSISGRIARLRRQ